VVGFNAAAVGRKCPAENCLATMEGEVFSRDEKYVGADLPNI
jgi:hypothetical protein